jgi:hypothetical protein
MEIPVVLGPGGGRDVSTITSAADTVIDLSAFVGRYVEVEFDQAALVSFIPSTGTFALSSSGAVAMALNPTSGTIVGKKVAKDTAIHRYVSPKWPRLIVRAQSTSITATIVKVAQDGYGV